MALSELNRKKSAIYIRVSTHWQIDKDSLQIQERELIAYSEYVLGITDYTIFKDAGYSAKNTERPDYQRMMTALRTGEYSHLLVWKIDRINRNLMDFCAMYSELKSMGITFVSKNEQFDTSSAIGEAMLKIILVFAELERGMTAERVTAVMLSRANNGQWNGGRIPFGYSYDKSTNTFSIVEPEASTVRHMFSYYLENQSLLQLANALNQKGIKTRAGNEWSAVSVHRILTNPFYKGQYIYNVHSDGKAIKKREPNEWITVSDHHPPIIDDVLFDRIQYTLTRNKRGGKSTTRKYIHPFSGLLFCGICGSPMTSTPGKVRANGFRPTLYGCSTRRRSKGCDNKYCTDLDFGPFIMNYVGNLIKSHSLHPTDTQSLSKILLKGKCFSNVKSIDDDGLSSTLSIISSDLTYYPKVQSDSFSTESYAAKKKKYELALNRLKSLYLYSDSPISEKDYIIEHERITSQISELDTKINQIEASITESKSFFSSASYLLLEDAFKNKQYIDYEKYIRAIDLSILKDFLKSIISRITIINGRVTSITFANGITHNINYSENNESTG